MPNEVSCSPRCRWRGLNVVSYKFLKQNFYWLYLKDKRGREWKLLRLEYPSTLLEFMAKIDYIWHKFGHYVNISNDINVV